MKLCCFVILVFISVTFAVGGEWGIGIRGVKSSPTPSTNQNEIISISYSQPPRLKHLLKSVDKKLEKSFQEEQEERQAKHPAQIQNQTSQTNQTNQTKFNGNNNKGKDNDHQQSEDNNDNTSTAKKLEEEAQTINRVIVVLGSLGASLLLVAIAIAVLYWKVRRQQKLVRMVEIQEDIAKGLSNGGESTCGTSGDDDNGNNENGDGSGNGKKDDGGGGVGNGETSINISENDGNESLFTINKKPVIIDSNPPSDIVGDDILEPQRTVIRSIQQSSSRPTAPTIEKIEGSNELDEDECNAFSAPHLAAPPAYTPTAPPIYALQYMPIDDSSTILTYQFSQQEDSINSETNNSNGTYIRVSPVAYAAGTTSQTNTPTNNTQQSTIIQANSSSTTNLNSSSTNLNSSSNSGGNNDDNNRPTNQRLTI